MFNKSNKRMFNGDDLVAVDALRLTFSEWAKEAGLHDGAAYPEIALFEVRETPGNSESLDISGLAIFLGLTFRYKGQAVRRWEQTRGYISQLEVSVAGVPDSNGCIHSMFYKVTNGVCVPDTLKLSANAPRTEKAVRDRILVG